MGDREFRDGRAIGSVKAAISMYGGGKINNGASNYQEKTSKASELHVAKSRISQINENRIVAESERSQAEFEFQKSKKLVRELLLQIAETKSRAKEFRKAVQVVAQSAQEDADRYEAVAREVEVVKRELSKIQLEIENVAEEKFRAEKEGEAADSRLEYYTSIAERLRMEIEEANEEEVLVEVAQIQARKELAEIEAHKKDEREKHLLLVEETRKKISVLRDEVDKMKDLEEMLELTNSDVGVLQNELNLIKEMDSRLRKSQRMQKKSGLPSVTADLEAAKKEFEVIKEKGIELMLSIDVIRNQLINMMKDKGKIQKMEAEKEKYMKKLNSKVLRAKDTLRVSEASEEKAKLMLPSFLATLENLGREKKAAKEEEESVKEQTHNSRAEIRKIESEMEVNEEKLKTVIKELEAVKSAEVYALEKLQALAETAVRERASKKKPTITISIFEYKYLMGSAAEAREIADKKEAAAKAWTEALMANEEEMKLKTAAAKSKIEELKLQEAEAVHEMEEAENEAALGTEELQKRRSMKGRDYSLTQARQAMVRSSFSSSGTRRISTSYNMKRRRKAMLVAKYFANEQNEN